jgi:hypothetical protein
MVLLTAMAGCGALSGGGVCDRVERATAHLRQALALCPEPQDAMTFGFNRANCDARQGVCTAVEVDAINRITDCDLRIAGCVSDAGTERMRVFDAVMACAADGGRISAACSAAATGR